MTEEFRAHREVIGPARYSAAYSPLGQLVAKLSTLAKSSQWQIGPQYYTCSNKPTQEEIPKSTEGGHPRTAPISAGGLVVCGRCGAKMVGKPRGDGARRYFCGKGTDGIGCNKTAILSEPFEEFIADAVLYRLDTPELQRKLISVAAQNDQAEALQDEIDRSQEELDELAQAYGDRRINMREWLLARDPIERRQAEASRRIGSLIGSSALEGYVGNAEHLRAQWVDLAPDRQRSIIGAIIRHVTVNPAVRGRTRFDPDRLEVLWRV